MGIADDAAASIATSLARIAELMEQKARDDHDWREFMRVTMAEEAQQRAELLAMRREQHKVYMDRHSPKVDIPRPSGKPQRAPRGGPSK